MIEAVGDSAALVGREMRHLRRVPAKLFGVTIVPIIFVAVFGYLLGSAMKVPNGNYREFIMAGIFAQVMLSGVTNTAIGVATDLQNGLVDRFRSLPISRSAVLVSRTISDLLLGIISSALMGIVGYWMGWRVREGFLKLLAGFALLVLLGVAMSWLGALLGLVMRSPEAVNAVGFVIVMPLAFLSTAFLPLTGLPGWLQTVAQWNPVSSLTAACRDLWGNPGAIPSNAFPAQHAVLMTIVSAVVLLVVAAPLAVRAYGKAVAR